MLSRALLASRYTDILLAAARRQGIEPASLFGDEPVFATRGRRTAWTHADLGVVSKNLRLATDDELWGMAPGHRIPLGTFKFACELCTTGETLGGALERAFRLYELVGPIRFSLETSGETASVGVSLPPACGPDADFLHEWWLWLWHYVAQWFAGAEIGLARVDFPHPPAVDPEAYPGTFGSRCSFGADGARFVFARRELARPVTRTLDELEQFFARPAVTLNYAPDVTSSTSTWVKVTLLRRLQHNEPLPTLEELADEQGVTGQTLRRWLLAENACYRSIKAEVRCFVARHHLSRPDATLGEIAVRAGFAEASAFTRAFRAWTGMNVSQFRRIAEDAGQIEGEPGFAEAFAAGRTAPTAAASARMALAIPAAAGHDRRRRKPPSLAAG
jgi:AraC-like DNA-binding protein